MNRNSVTLLICILLIVQSCKLDSLIFEPMVIDQYQLSTEIIPDSLQEVIEFTGDQGKLFGVWVTQVDSLKVEPHPVILYHHSHTENIQQTWPRIELLYRAGFSVFVYDYSGYGRSEGTTETEASMLADAQRAYDVVMNIEGVDSSLIVQYGFSFGSSPATHLAQNTSVPASRMIIESGHSTGEALVQSGTLLNIPGSYLLEGAFDNAGRIDDARAPLLVLHGVDDTLLPIEKHGDVLFDGALNPKTYNRVEGAGHSTIPQTLGEEFYIDLITSFIRGA